MKLLLLLSTFFYHVHAQQGEVVKTCIKGEGNFICMLGTDICKEQNGPFTCPKLCDVCSKPGVKPKAVFKKLGQCPQKRPSKVTPVFCWEATWNNGNKYEDKTVVFFYRSRQKVNGQKQSLSYSGFMLNDKEGQIFALGDVENGKHAVAFGINSKFTDDKRVEYKGESLNRPSFPGLFKAVPAKGTPVQVSGRSVGHKVNENTGNKKFNKREDVPTEGYTVYVQPIADLRFQNGTHGQDPIEHATDIVRYAAEAFKDPSLKVPIYVKVRDAILYNHNVTVDDAGYSTITTGATAFDFSQHYKYDEQNTTVYLFLTQTPVDSVPFTFYMLWTKRGGACLDHDQRVAIVEYFDSMTSAASEVTKAIAMMLGVDFDYVDGSDIFPIPRLSKKNSKSCTQMGGFMDAEHFKNRWTWCSNEDLEESVKNDTLKCLRNDDCVDVAFGCKRLNDDQCAFDMSYYNCRKTCGYCQPRNMTKCEDTDAVCMLGSLDPNLVDEYVCKTHPGFCPKACGIC